MTAQTGSTNDRSAEHLATADDLERASAEVAATNPDLSAELANEASSIRELVNGPVGEIADEPLLEELVVTVKNLKVAPRAAGDVPADPPSKDPSHFSSFQPGQQFGRPIFSRRTTMTAHTDQSFQGSLSQIAAMSERRKAALLGFGVLFLLIVVLIAIGQWLRFSDDFIIDLDEPPVEQPASRSDIPWQPHPRR